MAQKCHRCSVKAGDIPHSYVPCVLQLGALSGARNFDRGLEVGGSPLVAGLTY